MRAKLRHRPDLRCRINRRKRQIRPLHDLNTDSSAVDRGVDQASESGATPGVKHRRVSQIGTKLKNLTVASDAEIYRNAAVVVRGQKPHIVHSAGSGRVVKHDSDHLPRAVSLMNGGEISSDIDHRCSPKIESQRVKGLTAFCAELHSAA